MRSMSEEVVPVIAGVVVWGVIWGFALWLGWDMELVQRVVVSLIGFCAGVVAGVVVFAALDEDDGEFSAIAPGCLMILLAGLLATFVAVGLNQ
jgi:phage shock protein PspC (stress-responsive transcriptional regulator)